MNRLLRVFSTFLILTIALLSADSAFAKDKEKHRHSERLKQCVQMQSALEQYQTMAAMRDIDMSVGGGEADSTCVNIALCCQKGSTMCYAHAPCGQTINCTKCKC